MLIARFTLLTRLWKSSNFFFFLFPVYDLDSFSFIFSHWVLVAYRLSCLEMIKNIPTNTATLSATNLRKQEFCFRHTGATLTIQTSSTTKRKLGILSLAHWICLHNTSAEKSVCWYIYTSKQIILNANTDLLTLVIAVSLYNTDEGILPKFCLK